MLVRLVSLACALLLVASGFGQAMVETTVSGQATAGCIEAIRCWTVNETQQARPDGTVSTARLEGHVEHSGDQYKGVMDFMLQILVPNLAEMGEPSKSQHVYPINYAVRCYYQNSAQGAQAFTYLGNVAVPSSAKQWYTCNNGSPIQIVDNNVGDLSVHENINRMHGTLKVVVTCPHGCSAEAEFDVEFVKDNSRPVSLLVTPQTIQHDGSGTQQFNLSVMLLYEYTMWDSGSLIRYVGFAKSEGGVAEIDFNNGAWISHDEDVDHDGDGITPDFSDDMDYNQVIISAIGFPTFYITASGTLTDRYGKSSSSVVINVQPAP